MVVDESALLDRFKRVEIASVWVYAHEEFLDYIELDQEEDYHNNCQDEGRKGSECGDGFVNELIEVRYVGVQMVRVDKIV